MRRRQVSLAALTAFVVAGVFMTASLIGAQQPACLHGASEAPEQQARRERALGFARLINSVEIGHHTQTHPYQPLDKLHEGTETPPDGFAVHLVTDGASYAFSVKDTVDPCHYGVFSDQDQLIYVGHVLW